MGVKINSGVWGSVFAVPSLLVDEHIKRASGQQLKVFLYVFRHNTEELTVERISQGTGMLIDDVKDAMQYWVSYGILSMDDRFTEISSPEIILNKSVKEKMPETVPAKSEHMELPDVVPTHEQVAARILESPELKALYNEAQLKFGRTLGYDTQAKLLMIYDQYGLPVEVILTIIEYAVSKGKDSIRYIEKMAKDWADKDITTLEAADEYIKQIQKADKLWKKFEAMFSADPPRYTDKRISYLKKWNLEHKQSLDLIYYAYEETVNRINKINFNYMDKMLEDWYQKKLKTPVDVMQSEKKNSDNLSSKTNAASNNTSYDSSKYRKKAQQPIEYKRKNS